MGYSVPSKDRMARGRRPSGILTLVLTLVLILVLTLKSRCYFVYDIFAIVQTPLSCNVSLRVLRRAAYRS